MPLIMILYYLITVFLIALLVWNFVREKKSIEDMAMYLLVLIPLLLRVLRIK
jgi:cbb3-type cytochrome oxidase subunit 3